MENISTAFVTKGPEIFRELKDYSFRSFLGEGSFGAVYKAKNRVTGKYVAIKVNKAERWSGESKSDFKQRLKDSAHDFEREAKILFKVVKDTPNTLQIQSFIDLGYDNRMCIITDLHEGALMDLIKSDRAIESVLFQAWRHMLRAVDYLSAEGFCHRDIHPGNIFFSHKERDYGKPIVFFLGDFGLTARIGKADGKAGACGFRSPEMLKGGPSSSTSDVYSLWSAICYSLQIVKLFNRDLTGANFNSMRSISSSKARGWTDIVTDRPDRRPRAEELLARADSWGSFCNPDGATKMKRSSSVAERQPTAGQSSSRRQSTARPPSSRRSSIVGGSHATQGQAWTIEDTADVPTVRPHHTHRQSTAGQSSSRRSSLLGGSHAIQGQAWTVEDTDDMPTVRPHHTRRQSTTGPSSTRRQSTARQPTAQRIPQMDYNEPYGGSSYTAHQPTAQRIPQMNYNEPYGGSSCTAQPTYGASYHGEQRLIDGMQGLGLVHTVQGPCQGPCCIQVNTMATAFRQPANPAEQAFMNGADSSYYQDGPSQATGKRSSKSTVRACDRDRRARGLGLRLSWGNGSKKRE